MDGQSNLIAENATDDAVSRSAPRVALVHDWLTGMRGGEKCLDVLCRLWPNATLFTLFHRRGGLSPAIERMKVRTSFLQRVPGIFRNYRMMLPLMPAAIESLQLRDFDIVVSLSHCVAKSVRVPRGVPHVCYCCTPMRYAWHLEDSYFGRSNRGRALRSPLSALRPLLLADLRRWDRATAGRVTDFVAISRTVQRRIHECYGRASTLIFPPVNTDFFTPDDRPRDDFYLCVSAHSPYKRLDLAVGACSRLGRQLIVIGSGPEERRLRELAGPRVKFLGCQPDETIREHYRRCRALLFPGEEDFGLVPLEAQACGAPVIALAAGGATETVRPASAARPGTGLLFGEQTTDSLIAAILQFEQGRAAISPALARRHAETFRTERFAAEIHRFVTCTLRGKSFTSGESSTPLVAA